MATVTLVKLIVEIQNVPYLGDILSGHNIFTDANTNDKIVIKGLTTTYCNIKILELIKKA
jgi:uncharacterized protein YfaA (DUF2138 family)